MEFTDSLRYSERITVRSRHYFSVQHIQSAALFARQSYQIEKIMMGYFRMS